MKTIYCVMGRTASGKSTIIKEVCKKLNMTYLKSYTTREKRNDEDVDHIFISEEEVEQYRDDMIAYVDRVGYCSFATKSQLLESDFYIINPNSYLNMIENDKLEGVRYKTIIITTPYYQLEEQAKKRGDYETWRENYNCEDEEFKKINSLGLDDYRVLNNGTIEEAVKKTIKILERDKEKMLLEEINE